MVIITIGPWYAMDWLNKDGLDDMPMYSTFARELPTQAWVFDHLVARSRPRYTEREAYGMEQFDPKVVCLALESMQIRWNPLFDIEYDPRVVIEVDNRWQLGGDHRYDNVLGARKLLGAVLNADDHMVLEHVPSMPAGRAIHRDNVFGFLYMTKFGMKNLHFADHQEAYQEFMELAARGEPAPLHRIEEREEVIARELWNVLKQSTGRVYLVLDYQHFLPHSCYPTNPMRGERDRYLLFDFMEAERIPHVVVAPKILKSIGMLDTEGLERDWESTVINCHGYETRFALGRLETYFIQDYVSQNPDLAAKLKALEQRSRERDQSAKNKALKLHDNACIDNARDQDSVLGEIKSDTEIRQGLERFTFSRPGMEDDFIKNCAEGRPDLAGKLKCLEERSVSRLRGAKMAGVEEQDEAMRYNAGDRDDIWREIKGDHELQTAIEQFKQEEKNKIAAQFKKIKAD